MEDELAMNTTHTEMMITNLLIITIGLIEMIYKTYYNEYSASNCYSRRCSAWDQTRLVDHN